MIIFNGVGLCEGTAGVVRYAHCALEALRHGPRADEVEVWLPRALAGRAGSLPWPRIRIYPGPSPRRGFSFNQIFWANCLAWERRRRCPQARVFSPIETFVAGSWGEGLMTAHDCYADRFGDPRKGGRVGWGRRLAVRQLKRSRVLAVSQFTAGEMAELHGLGADRVSTTPNWLPRTFQTNPSAAELDHVRRHYRLPERFWLYVGGFRTNKNVSLLLRAYAEMDHPSRPTLVLAGGWPQEDTDYTGPLNAAWAGLGGATRSVARIGFVADDHLPALYRLAEVLISPSSYEGFGYPVIEAAAVGTAVLAARAASLPEVWPHPELLFSPDEPGELTRLLNRVAGEGAAFARRTMEPQFGHVQGEYRFNAAVSAWWKDARA